MGTDQNIGWNFHAVTKSNRSAARSALVIPQPGQDIPRKNLKTQPIPER